MKISLRLEAVDKDGEYRFDRWVAEIL